MTRITIVPSERHVDFAPDAWASPTTVVRFVERWLGRAEPLLGRASRAFARLSVRRALARASSREIVPEDPASVVRFAAGVERALGVAFASDLRAEDLRRVGTPRMRLLADVHERFTIDAAAANVIHPRAAEARLADAVAGGFEIPVDVDVRGVLGPSVAFCRLLAAMSARGRSVAVFLPAFGLEVDPLADVASFLERVWADAPRAPEIVWEPLSPLPPEVDVVEAAGPRAEARAIARATLDALNAGVSVDRAAVITQRGDDDAVRLAADALAEARVPASAPSRREGARIPELRALALLLDMIAVAFSRDALAELLMTRGIHFGSITGRADEHDAARVAEGIAHAIATLPVLRDRDGALLVSALEDRRDDPSVLARLVEIVGAVRRETTRPRFVAALSRLIETLRLGVPSAGTLSFSLRDEVGPELRASLGGGAVAVRSVVRGLEAIARAAEELGAADEVCALDELCEEVRLALREAITTADVGQRAGAVRITHARELAFLPIDRLVASGLTSHAYGATVNRDPWFDDETLGRLPPSQRPASARTAGAIELAELLACLSSARRATLTFSPRDDRGDEVALAHDLLRVARAGGARERKEPPSRVARDASACSPRGAELQRLAAGAPPPRSLRSRVAVDAARRAFFLTASSPPDASTGLVEAAARDRFVERFRGATEARPVPVTHLERYLECPFKAFARNVLRARKADLLDEALSAADRGSLIHDALLAGFETIAALPPSTAPDEVRARVRAAIEAALEIHRPMSALRREAHLTALEDAIAVIENPDLADPRWSFTWGEKAFAAREAPPWGPLRVGDDEPALFVEGRIDRVDLSADGAAIRVIDYKTGKAPSAFTERNVSLQLPLYAARVLSATGRASATTRYWFIAPKGRVEIRPKKDDQAALDPERLEAAIALARRAFAGVLRGEIQPRPAEPRTCARCDARDICRRPTIAASSDVEDARRPAGGASE